MAKSNVFQFLLLSTPVLLNAVQIVWVALVGTNPKYGSVLIAYSTIFTFPLVFIWHVGLIIAAFFGKSVSVGIIALVYGLANFTVSLFLFMFCFALFAPLLMRGGKSIMAL